MKLSLRLIILLGVSITLAAFGVAWNEVHAEQSALRADLEQRAEIAADRLREIVEPKLGPGLLQELPDAVERLSRRERLAGIAIYDAKGAPLAITSTLMSSLDGRPATVARACSSARGCGEFISMGTRPMYVYSAPLHAGLAPAGVLTTFQDASVIPARSAAVWRNLLVHSGPQILLIALVTFFVVQSTVLEPIAKTARWMRDVRFGRAVPQAHPADGDFLDAISLEAANLAEGLVVAQASAREEARLRDAGDSRWTAERLRVGIESRLQGSRLFVVSNREPYEHVHRGTAVVARVPPSGLVTALEPVLCACDGTWVAQATGDADREVVDAGDCLRVPPDHPRYTLRRVWLTAEEKEGYYFGFANEGLWPLCHIAHTRPIFRAGDWEHYRRVNQKFAQALLDEMADAEQPVVLIQDYHFALLPRLIKEKRPDARVAVFWHIPWPNPEAFGICPWQHELLDALLGADLVSFHIQAHCDNFLDTIDRSLECRIEWERSAVNRRDHFTVVSPHPISVAFPDNPGCPDASSPDRDHAAVRRQFGVGEGFLSVGVDRVDYTKGIIERFRGIERFLEKYPSYCEHFTFVQIAAPSRTEVKRYQDLVAEVTRQAERVNRRFQTAGWKPIVLAGRQHSHDEITPLYKAADVCVVTSLHDGMNLVAKEFVSCRADEDGVLILSQFTGACRELRDALLVNPYDIEQLAEAFRSALEMPAGERHVRMRRMRQTVRDHNVYRWAADLISELAEIRPEPVHVAADVH